MRPHQLRLFKKIQFGILSLAICMALFDLTPTLMQWIGTQPPTIFLQEIIRPWGTMPTNTPKEEQCLTQAIYYEAGNQSIAGKEAVALVILNRVGTNAASVCGVVHQAAKHEHKKICQFSYHCQTLRRPETGQWQDAKFIARRALTNIFDRDILLQLGDVRYFHAVYVRPRWAKDKRYVAQVGDHIFYAEPQAQD